MPLSEDTLPIPQDTMAPEPGPLSKIPLFARLDESEQKQLFGAMKRESYETNQTIFWIGDKGESLYIISSGRVLVTMPNEKGEHVSVATLGPGDIFGEVSLLDGGPRSATIRALESTGVYTLARSDFHFYLLRRPDAALDILAVMGARQRSVNDQLRHIRNPNIISEQRRSHWQRAADIIAAVAASQWFTIFHLVWFQFWIILNLTLPAHARLDPFPFGLLTMVVSLEAIFLSIFVMVSQNRQAERDRLRTDLDYQVNVKAHMEIMSLARRMEGLEAAIRDTPRKSD